MTSLYDIFVALMSADYPDKWALIKQKHESAVVQLIPDQQDDTSLVLKPPTGEIYLVYSTTTGWARYVDNTEIVPTINVGFEHWQEPNLLRHFNYMLHSTVDYPEESYIEVEEGSPLYFSFFNNLDVNVYFDVTVWYLVVKVKHWERVRGYLRRALMLYDKTKRETKPEKKKKV